MRSITQTPRLYLRPFQEKDAADLYALNAHPQAIEYTGDKSFYNIEDALNFVKNYDAYAKTGLGRWAVLRKEDHLFLGWCGLKWHPKEQVIDIGYRFNVNYWGNGYATEAARAVVDYAFSNLKIKKLVAHAHLDNIRSHAVLQKLDFCFLKDFNYDGMPAKVYTLTNPFYEVRQITTQETYEVRHPVLRPGRPLEDCIFDNDDAETTFHLGLFFKDQLIGIATFMKKQNELITMGLHYQLRGMAVLADFQNKGLGNLLIEQAIAHIEPYQITHLWCNAREKAKNFYLRQGFEVIGKPFDIPRIGKHYIMVKPLT